MHAKWTVASTRLKKKKAHPSAGIQRGRLAGPSPHSTTLRSQVPCKNVLFHTARLRPICDTSIQVGWSSSNVSADKILHLHAVHAAAYLDDTIFSND